MQQWVVHYFVRRLCNRVQHARRTVVSMRGCVFGFPQSALCAVLRTTLCMLQGPLADTCGHMWLMVWEQNSRAILMLNKIIEKGTVSRSSRTVYTRGHGPANNSMVKNVAVWIMDMT